MFYGKETNIHPPKFFSTNKVEPSGPGGSTLKFERSLNKEKFRRARTKIALALAFAFVLNFSLIRAQTVDDLNSKKTENQKKLEQINKQIKQYQQQIADTQKSANTLQNTIFIFDKQILSTELEIQAKETQIEDANFQIGQLELAIQQKNRDLAQNRKILAELLVQLNEFDGEYALKTTIGSESFSDFLDQIQYTKNYQDKIYQLVQKIKDIKAKLQAEQDELKVLVRTLEELKEQLKITQDSLKEQRQQKQVLLNQTRGLEKNYQKLLAVSKQEQDNLEKEIDDLDAQIRAKLGPKSTPAAKGVLAWPMDGILTQKYGNTGFTALGYNFHNGIDVAAPAGAPIYAAADGVVYDTDRSDNSYGNWVAIKHNISTAKGSSQIVTLYAHFRSFKVSPGQEVKQGDLIGYEGNTGNTTKKLYGPERGYHIHFGVYDIEGFGVKEGAYTKIYGHYKVPYGYTYNPMDFLE